MLNLLLVVVPIVGLVGGVAGLVAGALVLRRTSGGARGRPPADTVTDKSVDARA